MNNQIEHDNPNINVEKLHKTGLFTNYIFKAIPLAFDESMSYYETLCGLLSYLKDTIIPTVNNNADAIIELQNLYVILKDYVDNYFNNLDVQEEINNKLDAMVEDGTIPEIIDTYLNTIAFFGYDTINDMKESINLVNGSYAKTLGYHTKNDDGSAIYKIRTKTNEDTPDNMYLIQMEDSTLVAELIIPNTLYPEMLGAYGDGTHDDTTAITNALNIRNVKLSPNKTYLVTDTFTITNVYNLDCNNSIIKYNGTTTENYLFTINITGNRNDQRKSDYDIKIDCNDKCNGINFTRSYGNNFNFTIFKATYGLNLPSGSSCFENNISAQIDYVNGYGEIGCNITRGDNNIKELTIINYKVGVHNEGSTNYQQYHAWLDRNAESIYSQSIMFEDNTNGQGASIDYFYCDTYRYGVVSKNYAYVHIDQYIFVINKNEIATATLSSNPAITYYRNGSHGDLLVDYFNTYEDYTYLHILDTTTSDNTHYIINKANISSNIRNNMTIKELVFPISISSNTSTLFSSLPTALQSAYTDSTITLKPIVTTGVQGFIAMYYNVNYVYLYFGANVTNVANWRRISYEYV